MHPQATPPPFDFAKAPLLVIWESTRSCALACDHCRADADLRQDPRELSTAEGKALIRQVKAMGTPIMILSGGDPLNRPDLEELIAHGKSLGLRMGTIPAATPKLTKERLASLRDAGLDQVAFSLDGATAASHDGFRRTPGAYAKVLEAVGWAHELGLPVQLNTCFGAWNWGEFEELVSLVQGLPLAFWEVFFLIPVGRGARLGGLTPERMEAAYERLHRLTKEVPFVVKLTEGQPFRRFVAQAERRAGAGAAARAGSRRDRSPRGGPRT
jgi:AdoMet-dependent heme synthase